MAKKQKKDGDEGFLVELIDMLNSDLNVTGDRMIIENFIEHNIPDPNQLSLPSEPFDRRMSGAGPRGGFDMMTDIQGTMRGDDMVLQNLLAQLEGGVPTKRKFYVESAPQIGSYSLEGRDLREFFDSLDSQEGDFVKQKDLPTDSTEDFRKLLSKEI